MHQYAMGIVEYKQIFNDETTNETEEFVIENYRFIPNLSIPLALLEHALKSLCVFRQHSEQNKINSLY